MADRSVLPATIESDPIAESLAESPGTDPVAESLATSADAECSDHSVPDAVENALLVSSEQHASHTLKSNIRSKAHIASVPLFVPGAVGHYVSSSPARLQAGDHLVKSRSLGIGTNILAPAFVPGADGHHVSSSQKSYSLFVGDLDDNVDEQALLKIFQAYGAVHSHVVRDNVTRKSLGFGYVDFLKDNDAKRAMEELSFNAGPNTSGKPFRIFRKRRDHSNPRSNGGNLLIKNLDKSIDDRMLFEKFARFGPVLSSKVKVDKNGKSLGYGYVHYESSDSAKEAVRKVNQTLMNSKKVRVELVIPKSRHFTKVRISGIDSTWLTKAKLRELFAAHGEIKSVGVPTSANGEAIGFAFVNFAEYEKAKKAVRKMNGKKIDGKTMYVAFAKNQAEKNPHLRSRLERSYRSTMERMGHNLYVRNLCFSTDEEDLKKHFGVHGTITSCIVIRNPSGESEGYGFVCFSTCEEAQKALVELQGTKVGSTRRSIFVAMAHGRNDLRETMPPHFESASQFQATPVHSMSYSVPPISQNYVSMNQNYWWYIPENGGWILAPPLAQPYSPISGGSSAT